MSLSAALNVFDAPFAGVSPKGFLVAAPLVGRTLRAKGTESARWGLASPVYEPRNRRPNHEPIGRTPPTQGNRLLCRRNLPRIVRELLVDWVGGSLPYETHQLVLSFRLRLLR